MINTYDFQAEHPEIFSQLSVKDLLFLYYKCPQEEKKDQLIHSLQQDYFRIGRKKVDPSSGKIVAVNE